MKELHYITANINYIMYVVHNCREKKTASYCFTMTLRSSFISDMMPHTITLLCYALSYISFPLILNAISNADEYQIDWTTNLRFEKKISLIWTWYQIKKSPLIPRMRAKSGIFSLLCNLHAKRLRSRSRHCDHTKLYSYMVIVSSDTFVWHQKN